MCKKLFILTVLLVLLSSHGWAATVAVFPVEDLSQGRNGVNLVLTDYLRQNLIERGIEVTPADEVISFMARNRIRWLGFLDTSHLYQVREELGADFVLLGTVSQHQEDPMAALGMILTVVRTCDARTVWTEVGGVSKGDIENFLGLAEPENIDDLLPVLAHELLNSWPAVMADAEPEPCLVLDSTLLDPRYVKPGDDVHCTVRIRPVLGKDDLAAVKLMVGDDDLLVMHQERTNIYTATWQAPDRNESIPVTLVLEHSSGAKDVFFVGNYRVDNKAPEIKLKLKGRLLDNTIAFNNQLPIIPIWQIPEPISHWFLAVLNMDGEVMVSGEAQGALPKRFLWRGQRPDGHKADDGLYEVVLKVWDRADNVSVVREKVLLAHNPPNLQIDGYMDDDNLEITLSTDGKVPVNYWSFEVLFSDGEVFLQQQGDTLPAKFVVPYPPVSEDRKIESFTVLRDVLGNRAFRKLSDLMQYFAPAEEEIESQEPEEDEWVTEF